ncbi:MAG TPA: hypothetical protein VFH95_10970 [Candidatus Kapabacteria bacterium]|nr:hypothetical protein [Candidatus Kapabacteria bacterium]
MTPNAESDYDGFDAVATWCGFFLDLSRLDAGVYLLVTTTNKGDPDAQRVVVAK